jgi:hypothetical protein
MGLTSRLRAMLGTLGSGPELARAERVAALIPADSEYVTLGTFQVLPDARAFVGGTPGTAPYRYDFGPAPSADALVQEVGLLVLAGRRLRLVDSSGERWSVDCAQLTDLDGHRHSGFVVVTSAVDGLAVGIQTPVEVPPGVAWRTVGRVSNVFGGWDQALSPYGVHVHR